MFVSQKSCEELLALQHAGVLDMACIRQNSTVQPQNDRGIIYKYEDEDKNLQSAYFETFVECISQQHLSHEDFPFKTHLTQKEVSPARLNSQSKEMAFIAEKRIRSRNG